MIGPLALRCQDMKHLLRSPIAIALSVWLVCAFAPAFAAPPLPAAENKAEEQAADGDYAGAAQVYLQAAESVSPTERSTLLIRAAEAALRGDRRDLAMQAVRRIDTSKLTLNQRVRIDLVLLALGELPGGPADWLQRLPPPGKDADPDFAERLSAARADAYLRQGDVVAAVQALVERERWLSESDAISRNQARIWSILRSAPSTGTQFQGRGLDSVTQGWLDLATLQRAVWTQVSDRNESLDAWERRYSQHPGADMVLDLMRGESLQPVPIQAVAVEPVPTAPSAVGPSPSTTAPVTTLGAAGQIKTLALILPLSGSLAPAARAVRDGFLAAWFEQPAPRPRVLVLDSGADASAMLGVYQRARAAGAQMVVGPLSKESVASLARMITPGQPVLALNYLDGAQAAPAGFFQFGLAPEDEARQVADRALRNGHRRAVALVPEGDWGNRTLAAFRERLESQGGKLLDVEAFPASLRDFSVPVRRLLNLKDSEQRKESLNSLLGEAIEFANSPGALPDFVFIAAQPQHARLIRPQLRFHGAGQLPLYATSLVYEGTAVPARDADLNDIQFCDMPFLLGADDKAGAREKIRALWPSTYSQHPRLYAFGYDAARLALRVSSGGSRDYMGVTGHLHVGEDGRIRRDLLWARFENGRPRLLGE